MKLFNKKKNMNKGKKLTTEEIIQEVFKENLKYISNTEIDPKIIEEQFVKTNTRFFLTVGEIDCPTGEIIVSDPLCYLANNNYLSILDEKIPKGKYKVETSICRDEIFGIRMCTARLKVKDTKAVKYVCAKSHEEKNGEKTPCKFSGFPVDAGMMSFCDKKVALEYLDFIEKWHEENKDKNHYDDYFAKFFDESFQKYPAYQREGGDFICWTNPKTNNNLVMIASGFGDGFYQSFWGYDKDNEICELIVPMVNPNLFLND